MFLMSGRAAAAGGTGAPRPSRQISIVLRPAEQAAQPAEPPAVEPAKGLEPGSPFAEIQRELDAMVGMEKVKALIYEIYALLHISGLRSAAGLAVGPQVYHMIFRGNPGTGKTTIARIVAKLFQKMGVLQKGHLIEVERADLVGEYIGHTAQKTRELVRKALGGVLFVDEAYSLARGGEKDFGKEAIDTLVKAMEDYKNQFVLILAGYPDEIDMFLLSNPGLPSRFPIRIDFPDYTVDQLVKIAELMAKERDYELQPQAVAKLRQHLAERKRDTLFAFSNARYVRNMIERAIRHQAVRLLNLYGSGQPGRQELMTLRAEDLRWEPEDA